MISLNLKDHVKDKQLATLQFVTKDVAVYITGNGLEFEVPLNDIGNGSLRPTEKAISLMKWIRKGLENVKKELEHS
jgi:hypothetical protein